MEEFKLLAIRPLSGCHQHFLKNLSPGLCYSFYSSYNYFNEQGTKAAQNEHIHFIDAATRIPNDLYQVISADGHSLQVNISAVAGKNGSGKSSLIDILFAVIYLFSIDREIIEPNLATLSDKNYLVNELRDRTLDLLELLEDKEKVFQAKKDELASQGKDIGFDELQAVFYNYKNERWLRQKLDQVQKDKEEVPQRIREIQRLQQELKAEVYYQLGGSYYCLTVSTDVENKPIAHIRPINDWREPERRLDSLPIDSLDLSKHFFYTISVNYSHYALNATFIGQWINTLFHKNDGYTAPLVINPMRTAGDFEINREIELAKYRLLTNVMTEYFYKPRKPVKVTDMQQVKAIRFTLDKAKIKAQGQKVGIGVRGISGTERETNLLLELLGFVEGKLDLTLYMENQFPLKAAIINYIVNKVDRISELYPGFEHGYRYGPEAPLLDSRAFLKSLIEDGTHITNKLVQAIAFLRYNLLESTPKFFQLEPGQLENEEEISFTYTPKEVIEYMNVQSGAELIKKLPPSIFKIDFILINPKIKEEAAFHTLSSGEQQIIHTIQSVIYHLNNLQSAHASKKPERLKYEAINIVYDEIELYFHPEYQRRLIQDILKALGRLHLPGISRIRTVNFLFLTHSPFILSDIPKDNIMLLEINKKTSRSVTPKVRSQPFAANINDLLADSFFLKGSLMGHFAENKVNQLIDKINHHLPLNKTDLQMIKMIGDEYLRISIRELIKANDD
jgi:hypothetical protein